jgi:7,8-dihydro-6-hydroxymethylpterin-pyrophosphokinase
VVAIRWTGTPGSLLEAVKEVERRGGRVPTFRNGPREIDVDIMDLRGLERNGRDPILPHPRMARRRFVLVPLDEIAPRWKHPVTGLTAKQMLSELPVRPGVRKIARGAAHSLSS